MKKSLIASAASFAAASLCSALCAAAPAASYIADPQQSRLEFAGVQAGAEFKAVFHKFTAAVDLRRTLSRVPASMFKSN